MNNLDKKNLALLKTGSIYSQFSLVYWGGKVYVYVEVTLGF